MSDPRPPLKDRIRDAADRFGEWLDDLLPAPPTEGVLVPVPVRRRRTGPQGPRRR